MNYDENIFKAKANQRARKIWLIFALLLTANYGSDTSKGIRSGPYFLTFVLLCWIPFFAGQILLKVKGMATDYYKYEIAIGYGIFYTFVFVRHLRTLHLRTYCRLPVCLSYIKTGHL